MAPLYSVVIAWADRDELEASLNLNRSLFERYGVEVVVVNGGGDSQRLRSVLRRSAVSDVRAVDLPGARFNRSLCVNVGVLLSRGAYLFLLDADIVLKSDIFADSYDALCSGSRFVAIRRIIESVPKPPRGTGADWSFLKEMVFTRELLTTDGRRAVLRSRFSPNGVRAGDGLVLVRSDHLRAVGGLNSKLTGYGFEDTDLQLRLQLFLGLERVEAGEVVHLTHGARDHNASSRNMQISAQHYSRGDFLGSLELDANEWRAALVDLAV